MRRRTIRIDGGQVPRLDDAGGDRFAVEAPARERVARDRDLCTREPAIGQVREDAEARAAAAHLLDQRRQPLDERVDGVRAHRVARVDEDVHDHHGRLVRSAEAPHLEVARTRPAPAEARREGARRVEQRRPGAPETLDRREAVGDVDELDLADHDAVVGLGGEAAAGAGEQRRARGRGDHRRLLDDERHDDVLAVHLEVERDAERQRERADGVLDHAVGELGRQPIGREGVHVAGRQSDGRRERAAALDQRQAMESSNA